MKSKVLISVRPKQLRKAMVQLEAYTTVIS
jgi:hypothetical protein